MSGTTDRAIRHPLFLADWHHAAFLHFTLPSRIFEPFCYEGVAYVSLVAFTQRHLRPAFGGRIGAFLARPLASHEFFNLRTYVRHGATRGIYFLAEWIPNRVAVLAGPRTYGLPYRLGHLSYAFDFDRGTVDGNVQANGAAATFQGSFGVTARARNAEPGSLDAFLLERYTAFTCRHGRLRRFDVAHAPWPQRPLRAQVADLGLLNEEGAWAQHLKPACAHISTGVADVTISAPRRVRMATAPEGRDLHRSRAS